LAWKAPSNHVNNSAPRLSVKGANVIPNREGREKAVILSGGKNACGVRFAFNCANRSPAKQLASEYSSTSACEKSQLIHCFSMSKTANKSFERTREHPPRRYRN